MFLAVGWQVGGPRRADFRGSLAEFREALTNLPVVCYVFFATSSSPGSRVSALLTESSSDKTQNANLDHEFASDVPSRHT
jgi:hypothetical protein